MITASAMQGQIPPPFESVAEKRWVEENKATPYTQADRAAVIEAARRITASP